MIQLPWDHHPWQHETFCWYSCFWATHAAISSPSTILLCVQKTHVIKIWDLGGLASAMVPSRWWTNVHVSPGKVNSLIESDLLNVLTGLYCIAIQIPCALSFFPSFNLSGVLIGELSNCGLTPPPSASMVRWQGLSVFMLAVGSTVTGKYPLTFIDTPDTHPKSSLPLDT